MWIQNCSRFVSQFFNLLLKGIFTHKRFRPLYINSNHEITLYSIKDYSPALIIGDEIIQWRRFKFYLDKKNIFLYCSPSGLDYFFDRIVYAGHLTRFQENVEKNLKPFTLYYISPGTRFIKQYATIYSTTRFFWVDCLGDISPVDL